MGTLLIGIDNDLTPVNRRLFRRWFPYVWKRAGGLVADVYTADIRHRLAGHTRVHIGSRQVNRALKELFAQLDTMYGRDGDDRVVNVERMLDRCLRDDRLVADYRGLCDSRHRYLILCCFANHTRSHHLARALGNFISNNAHSIANYEDTIHLREWSLGLLELQGLLPDCAIREVTDLLSDTASNMADELEMSQYHDYIPGWCEWTRRMMNCRGRTRQLLGGPHGFDPRALSAPAARRCRSLDQLRIGRPISRSAWPSPVMSPAVFPASDYFDHVNGVRWEQAVQAAEVEELRHRVGRLEWKS